MNWSLSPPLPRRSPGTGVWRHRARSGARTGHDGRPRASAPGGTIV